MPTAEETLSRLTEIPHLQVSTHAPLSRHTRFGIGGPADVFVETSSEESFMAAFKLVRAVGIRHVVIGAGTNLIVSDDGFRGVVLKLVNRGIRAIGNCVMAEAGAVLQDLVDFTIDHGMHGMETMTGIPGFVGAAVYGNAGAYGHSIHEWAHAVRFFDGGQIRVFGNSECQFHYRESIFKKRKDWIIFSVDLHLESGERDVLRKTAGDILTIRNEKYPPTMKCAGSIFKNYLLAELPPNVAETVPAKAIREGKVASAYFLEQVDVKGMRVGDIHIATYHANLIYNAGQGTARDLRTVIDECKRRVLERFGMPLEEEVQYVGFELA